jgi:hypothetical protein
VSDGSGGGNGHDHRDIPQKHSSYQYNHRNLLNQKFAIEVRGTVEPHAPVSGFNIGANEGSVMPQTLASDELPMTASHLPSRC